MLFSTTCSHRKEYTVPQYELLWPHLFTLGHYENVPNPHCLHAYAYWLHAVKLHLVSASLWKYFSFYVWPHCDVHTLWFTILTTPHSMLPYETFANPECTFMWESCLPHWPRCQTGPNTSLLLLLTVMSFSDHSAFTYETVREGLNKCVHVAETIFIFSAVWSLWIHIVSTSTAFEIHHVVTQ